MKVVPYDPKYRQAFIDINTDWITKWYRIEENDRWVFDHVDDLIAGGSMIFFALDDGGKPEATCLIERKDEDGKLWEFEKFGAVGQRSKDGAGTAVMLAALDYAKGHGAEKVVIVTHHKCGAAMHLYEKYGFRRLPEDVYRLGFSPERADVWYELDMADFSH